MARPIGKLLRDRTKQAVTLLTKVTEEGLASVFKFYTGSPSPPMQYWQWKLAAFAPDDTSYDSPCGWFIGGGSLRNAELGIQRFFENNDIVFDQLRAAQETGLLDCLLPIVSSTDDWSFEISIISHLCTSDEWLRCLCDELVASVTLDRERPDAVWVYCGMDERWRIRIPGKHGPITLDVPFSQVDRFNEYERLDAGNVPYFEYQVALSFAGQDRDYAKRIASWLKRRKIRVFYDEYEKASLWGKDLYAHLDEVYRRKARWCVILISEAYRDKVWTNHERQSAQARAFQSNEEYILPVRLDDTEIPGVRPTLGYIDGRKTTVKELVDLICEKARTR